MYHEGRDNWNGGKTCQEKFGSGEGKLSVLTSMCTQFQKSLVGKRNVAGTLGGRAAKSNFSLLKSSPLGKWSTSRGSRRRFGHIKLQRENGKKSHLGKNYGRGGQCTLTMGRRSLAEGKKIWLRAKGMGQLAVLISETVGVENGSQGFLKNSPKQALEGPGSENRTGRKEQSREARLGVKRKGFRLKFKNHLPDRRKQRVGHTMGCSIKPKPLQD